MDDRERRAAEHQVRGAALLAAATARIGTGASPGQLTAEAAQYVAWITRPPATMALAIVTKGDPDMLSIDSLNSVANLSFADRQNEATAAPAGALAVATSSNPAVMTVGPAAAGTDANGVPIIQFALAEVTEGTSTLSVTVTDAGGNPLLGPDGVTPIPDPAPVDVVVNPGAPAAEIFTVPGN